jgi:ABC-type nitrate/sulfonate/bicarbonate transport system permease component
MAEIAGAIELSRRDPGFVGGLAALVYTLIVIAVCFGLWAGSIAVFDIPDYVMPTPWATLETMGAQRGAILGHVWFTVRVAVGGLLVSSFIALTVASTFTASRTVARTAMPLVIAMRSAPLVAIAPLITLMAGRGFATGVIVVVIASFFPLLVNALQGLSSVTQSTYELMHVLGATRFQILRMVRFPFALPYIFTGLRVASASAILGAMLAEWLTGQRGVGYLILESAETRELELLWAAILAATLLAFVSFTATVLAERALGGWRLHDASRPRDDRNLGST